MLRKKQIAKAKQLYCDGMTLKQVGTVFGVSHVTISRLFKKHHIKVRNKSEAASGHFNGSWK